MPTKIQIPTSGNPPTTHIKKGNQCYWASNGHNTYNLTLPAGEFTEFPNGGTIQAANGGNSQTVTVMPTATAGSTIRVAFSQVQTAAASGGTQMVAQDSATTSSGQSDIIVDP